MSEWQVVPCTEMQSLKNPEKMLKFKVEPSEEEPGGVVIHLNFEAAKLMTVPQVLCGWCGTVMGMMMRKLVAEITTSLTKRLERMEDRIDEVAQPTTYPPGAELTP